MCIRDRSCSSSELRRLRLRGKQPPPSSWQRPPAKRPDGQLSMIPHNTTSAGSLFAWLPRVDPAVDIIAIQETRLTASESQRMVRRLWVRGWTAIASPAEGRGAHRSAGVAIA
eukprot:7347278-Prorocentrum_lima.AAC.1